METGKNWTKGEGPAGLAQGRVCWRQFLPQRPLRAAPRAGGAQQVSLAALSHSPSASNDLTYLASENGFI